MPAFFTIILTALPLITLPDHIDQVVNVLMDLIKRDEGLVDGQSKLGDKLIKWVTAEVDKVSNPSRT